jgi:hypothetical protein
MNGLRLFIPIMYTNPVQSVGSTTGDQFQSWHASCGEINHSAILGLNVGTHGAETQMPS